MVSSVLLETIFFILEYTSLTASFESQRRFALFHQRGVAVVEDCEYYFISSQTFCISVSKLFLLIFLQREFFKRPTISAKLVSSFL